MHPTVIDLLEKDHSVEVELEPMLDFRADTPAIDMIVVKFAVAFESDEHTKAAVREAESAWLSLSEPLGGPHMSHAAVVQSLGRGSWGRVLRRLTGEALSEGCSSSLDSMASDVVYYRGHMELRHVDAYLQSGGDEAKRCLSLLVHRLSSDNRVLSVTGQSIPRLLNYLARGICQTGDPQSYPMSEEGLTGVGEIVGVADSGLNDGSCFFWDDSGKYSTNRVPRRSVGSTYVEADRRKVIQYISHADGDDEIGGHGTHVCGTIAGNTLNEDFIMGNGVAPDAKIAFLDVQASDNAYLSIPDLENQLLKTLYNAGARVFSNSWGGYATSYYSERCADADSFLYKNPNTLVLFAAGNAGADGFESLYSPCDSKNILCVGSSDSRADLTDESDISERISHFSSMGPTFDGRIKPDVVGPGMSLVSAMSGTNAAMSCGTVDMFGTSMATPAVAGAALLVREYFKTKYGTVCRPEYHDCGEFEPSGVLTKAILIHSAFGLNSYSSMDFDSRTTEPHFSLGDTPDPYQGFGQVAIADILPLSSVAAARKDLYVKDMFFVKSKSVYEMSVSVKSFDVPFRVTLVWYDPPSALGASGYLLINNIDLEVYTPDGNSYLGNGVYDNKNTVEQVTVKRTDWESTGDFIIRVSSSVLANSAAQYVAIVVTCDGIVTSELSIRSGRRLGKYLDGVSSVSSYRTIVKSADAQAVRLDDVKVPSMSATTFDSGFNASAPVELGLKQDQAAQNDPSLRGAHSAWKVSRDFSYWSNEEEKEGFTSVWTSNKYEVDVDVTLASLQEACFDPIDISNSNLRLFSVRMSMNGAYLGGNDAFVAGVIVTAPNGEKVQIGGYHTYSATTRIWARTWPIQWTGIKKNKQVAFDGTRVVNMAPMGKDSSGKWSVCLQLLHAGWSNVHYVGQVYIAFDEIPMEDVSSPATIKGQLKADAEIIAVSVVCSALVVFAVLTVFKHRTSIYAKLSRSNEEVDDSSVSSVSSVDPNPISSCVTSDDGPDGAVTTLNSKFFKKPFYLPRIFSAKNRSEANEAATPSNSAPLAAVLVPPLSSTRQPRLQPYTISANAIRSTPTSNPLHALGHIQRSSQEAPKLQAPAKSNL